MSAEHLEDDLGQQSQTERAVNRVLGRHAEALGRGTTQHTDADGDVSVAK